MGRRRAIGIGVTVLAAVVAVGAWWRYEDHRWSSPEEVYDRLSSLDLRNEQGALNPEGIEAAVDVLVKVRPGEPTDLAFIAASEGVAMKLTGPGATAYLDRAEERLVSANVGLAMAEPFARQAAFGEAQALWASVVARGAATVTRSEEGQAVLHRLVNYFQTYGTLGKSSILMRAMLDGLDEGPSVLPLFQELLRLGLPERIASVVEKRMAIESGSPGGFELDLGGRATGALSPETFRGAWLVVVFLHQTDGPLSGMGALEGLVGRDNVRVVCSIPAGVPLPGGALPTGWRVVQEGDTDLALMNGLSQRPRCLVFNPSGQLVAGDVTTPTVVRLIPEDSGTRRAVPATLD